ncbi:MAG: hypothetical protein WB523_21480 [Candidatus Sulfotelmatobacter sp.]
MACMTLFAPQVAMATTQLSRVIRYEQFVPRQLEQYTEQQPLRMNWVVVTDRNGSRRLRMRWAACEI